MKIRFYGRLAQLLGEEIDVAVSKPCSVEDVRQLLSSANPAAAEVFGNKRVRACVGDEIVPDHHRVEPSDELEFLAPVSGG